MRTPRGAIGKSTARKNQPGRGMWMSYLWRAVAFVVVVIISISVYQIRGHVAEFSEFGYPGLFLTVLLANATVLLPAPGLAVVFAMGSILNPALVAVVAGSGGALGELTGYLAGFSGTAVVERVSAYERLLPWVRKYGGWAVMVLAALPNPFFDLAGIAAGVTKMGFWRFLLFCWFGQLLKMTVFAFAGQQSISWLAGFLK